MKGDNSFPGQASYWKCKDAIPLSLSMNALDYRASDLLDPRLLHLSYIYVAVSSIELTSMKYTSIGEPSLGVPSMVTRVATCFRTSSPITARTCHVQYQTSIMITEDEPTSNA